MPDATGSIPGTPYPNAPIVEAVIDVQVQFGSSDAAVDEALAGLRDALHSTFVNALPIRSVGFELDVKDDQSRVSSAPAQMVGWRLTNAATNRVLQIQRRGFTYSHLAPYSEWSNFEREGLPLWQRFVDNLDPVRVTRTALRYINKIAIPLEQFNPDQYLNIYPQVPATVGGSVEGLFMQLQVPQENLGEKVAITVALLQREKAGVTPVLLDIDMFTERHMRPAETSVWETLRRFRKRKNFLFESFITDETRKLFQ